MSPPCPADRRRFRRRLPVVLHRQAPAGKGDRAQARDSGRGALPPLFPQSLGSARGHRAARTISTTKFGSAERYNAASPSASPQAAAAEGLDLRARQDQAPAQHARLPSADPVGAARSAMRAQHEAAADGPLFHRGRRPHRPRGAGARRRPTAASTPTRCAQRLASDDDVERVEREANSAKEAGIDGVPCFIFGGARRRVGRAGARASRAGDRARRRRVRQARRASRRTLRTSAATHVTLSAPSAARAPGSRWPRSTSRGCARRCAASDVLRQARRLATTIASAMQAPRPGADQHDGGIRDRDRPAAANRARCAAPVTAPQQPADRSRQRTCQRDEHAEQPPRRRAARRRPASGRLPSAMARQADDQRQRRTIAAAARRMRALLADEKPERQQRQRMRGHEDRMQQSAVESIDACDRRMGAARDPRPTDNRTTTAERRTTALMRSRAQEGDAGERDRAAGRAHGDPSGGPARQQAEADAGEVQQSGRDHEADRIGDRIGAGRQLGAMGVAVEDREARRPARPRPRAAAAPPAPPSGRARPPRPRCRSRRRAAARRECRARRRTPSPAETRSASSQIAGAPEERAPQPDRHHRGDVVGPEHRMREAADEAAREPIAGVGEGRASGTDRQPGPSNACRIIRSGASPLADHDSAIIKDVEAGDKPG